MSSTDEQVKSLISAIDVAITTLNSLFDDTEKETDRSKKVNEIIDQLTVYKQELTTGNLKGGVNSINVITINDYLNGIDSIVKDYNSNMDDLSFVKKYDLYPHINSSIIGRKLKNIKNTFDDSDSDSSISSDSGPIPPPPGGVPPPTGGVPPPPPADGDSDANDIASNIAIILNDRDAVLTLKPKIDENTITFVAIIKKNEKILYKPITSIHNAEAKEEIEEMLQPFQEFNQKKSLKFFGGNKHFNTIRNKHANHHKTKKAGKKHVSKNKRHPLNKHRKTHHK